ncbi:molybdate ABC transporter substrate-binding protein [Jiangella rhizosphaerae]|uniref:Molybdate ABC transporter substrate-binding protein n=1 Tax=Jiangella rhizosphaerae TaxID=2293569 RepID=A0A418KPZ8_9ACTN|nr:molybdate ABC transporter substrate-binding protein [Jiangella rhizosphaerae]RIQ21285.1 molybdate ABC transporter substrate-binding protein [Jiangella rhizosphaerae]
MRPAGLAAVVAAAALLTAACGGDDGDSAAAADAGEPGRAPSGTVTVLAAASLTESFEELADQLRDAHPDLEIVYSFGPSSGLVEQALSGAPADVLATADARTMDEAVAGGMVDGEPRVFARNTLALAVPAGNPGDVRGLADLANDDLRIAICEPQVPCGGAAQRLLDAAGVTAAPDTLTTDVKEAASLVALGEADAALIYRTDAAAEGDAVETIDVPEADEVVNDYPVAVLADAPNPEGAQAVVDAITGELGRTILGAAGFLTR